MKNAAVGALIVGMVAGVMFLVTVDVPRAEAQRPANFAAEGTSQLIALDGPSDQTYQQITVIDPQQQVMGSYQIELATGIIHVRSVRNITWDLQMEEFDTGAPFPREVRSMIQQR